MHAMYDVVGKWRGLTLACLADSGEGPSRKTSDAARLRHSGRGGGILIDTRAAARGVIRAESNTSHRHVMKRGSP
jgi:hypothetical protein